MSMERNALQNYRTEVVVIKTATATLTPAQTNVKVDCSLGVAITITLPPVALCRGKIFAIRQIEASASVTLKDDDKSSDWPGDITLNALHDRALLYADGECWWILTDMYT